MTLWLSRFRLWSARDARSTIGPTDAEDRLMNYDRHQVSSLTNDVSFQPRELSNYSEFVPSVDDLGRHSENMSTSRDALGAPEIKVGESDKICFSASSNHQFRFALAGGAIIAGVAIGWGWRNRRCYHAHPH